MKTRRAPGTFPDALFFVIKRLGWWMIRKVRQRTTCPLACPVARCTIFSAYHAVIVRSINRTVREGMVRKVRQGTI